MRMLWLMLHSSYYILYIHIRPSIPYIVGALSCIWGLLMRVFSGTGNAKYYSPTHERLPCRLETCFTLAMDQSHINNQNFELNKSRKNFHHSLKEHHKISNIPKFRCEML